MSPQKVLKSKPPAPVNVTFSGNQIYTDDQGKMRSLGWTHSSMTGVLLKGKSGYTHPKGECHVKMKAEIRAMHLHPKEDQRLPINHQNLGERPGADPPSEGTGPANVLICDLQPPEL